MRNWWYESCAIRDSALIWRPSADPSSTSLVATTMSLDLTLIRRHRAINNTLQQRTSHRSNPPDPLMFEIAPCNCERKASSGIESCARIAFSKANAGESHEAK